MIVYEVNLEVDADLAGQFAAWLRRHIADMLCQDGFMDASCLMVDEPPAGKVLFCVHYRLRDRAALEHYLETGAAAMRQAGIDRFGEHMRAWRRIMRQLGD